MTRVSPIWAPKQAVVPGRRVLSPRDVRRHGHSRIESFLIAPSAEADFDCQMKKKAVRHQDQVGFLVRVPAICGQPARQQKTRAQ